MSPSEFQLRRALSEGEGAPIDVDDVIARVQDFRHQRRTRVLTVAAAVIVVAGIGTGVGVVASSSSSHKSATAADSAGTQAGTANGAGAAVHPQPNLSDLRSPITCPQQAPNTPVTTAAAKPFFTSRVASVTVCGYQYSGLTVTTASGGSAKPAPPLSATYSGTDAAAIVSSIENAARSSTAVHCGAIPAAGLGSIAVLARYTDGTEAAPVLIGVGACNSGTVRNGTTTRYDWQQPSVLSSFLAAVRVAATSAGGNSFEPTPPTATK